MAGTETGHTFNNGLSGLQEDFIFDIQSNIEAHIENLNSLPRHRSLSLAVTKLEEANLWLRDRLNKPEAT